ncbi:low affinity immunoglobulin gamma Fc region receptor III-A isoform X3 [Moschus berezovskii]|uniref:low affinity immunoglobulin gamma Fc region receptor III-A isoform X3 n=1 Tax=Moschus berezovskii TaxID=68408 RepID=UPI002444D173|nr:low affinity immunoglobulin gamma Fc region receptor III-A isoform X3 [Moschus berezovskii]
MWQLLPPAALLLLVSADTRADLSKAVVLLDPQWNQVLKNDRVTLKCQGDYPVEDNSTKWWHNGTLISSQTSSYFIADAKVEDSGEYKCQTGLSALSDPVKLEVHASWLLLQVTQRVVNVGKPIHLKCHSWKKTTVAKVQYFQNGRGKKYFHQNSDFYIPEAKLEHSGSYFCRGIIGTKNESSESVQIIVQGLGNLQTVSSFYPPWHQITFCLVMGLLFAVDTGLYFSVQRHLRNSEEWRNDKVTWSKGP